MIIRPLSKDSVTFLSISSRSVECVSTYKLLGVMINTLLKWDDHIDDITTKAAMILSFLKTLERAPVRLINASDHIGPLGTKNACKLG